MPGPLQDQLLKSALDLAARGLRVFPLVPGTKRPAIKNWPKLATSNPNQITRVWSTRPFNIGVAMGGGMLGLDVDMKNGKDGMASLRELGVELNGFVVRTPTGGKHGYFTGPDVSNNAGRLGRGLDVRSGGGFLVGPGSRTEDGDYVLERSEGFSAVPAIVVQRCVAPVERDGNRTALVDAESGSVEGTARAWLEATFVATEGQAGDHTTFVVACRLKDLGLSEDTAYELLLEHWNERCEPPWAPEDLRTKVRNAYEYGTSPPGIAHPAVEFADVRVEALPAEAPRVDRWFRHGDAHGKISWLYYNLLPMAGNTVLVAPSQAGKTFFLIELARSLATGKPFFGVEPDERGGTLFVFAGSEGSGFPHRLDALQEGEPLPISALPVGNLAEGKTLTALLEELKTEAVRILEVFGVPVRMVVLETLSAAGLLKDENDNAEASRAMTNLAQIGRALNAVVVTSHHPDKEGKGSRGASAIPNAADCVLEIHRHGKGAVREVELFKARNAEQRKLGTFTLLPVELGEDERGRPIVSMTVSEGGAMTDSLRASPYVPTFLESLEWALEESGEEMDDGARGVEVGAVRAIFRDRKKGSKDPSNMGKAFNGALAYCESVGAVRSAPWLKTTYLIKQELGDDDD